MKTEVDKSEQSSEAKSTLVSGMFYTFVILTVLAALFHLFGIKWLAGSVEIPEPHPVIAKIIKALLKVVELVFMYKLTTKKGFGICILISIAQTALVGFLPTGTLQSVADIVFLVAFPLVFRQDRGNALIDTVFLYLILCIYAGLFLLAKFGGLALDYGYSFYASILGVIDYKLFVVTLYLYVNYKGGIQLWMKRKLFS